MTARVLILRAAGINRDEDAANAVELAGGRAERIHVNRVIAGETRLADYAMLIIPGGFSYGDQLGAGKLLAVDLIHRLSEQLAAFVADQRPVLGICNGFQVLVKAGVLPGLATDDQRPTSNDPSAGSGQAQRPTTVQTQDFASRPQYNAPLPPTPLATLTNNHSGRFECRWVYLAATASRCIFTHGIEAPIEVPVAHGEGRFVARDAQVLAALEAAGQVTLRYVVPNGEPQSYPANPNGSDAAIAGICNPAGTVLGLMPHPENAVRPTQHPRWTRQPHRREGDGLILFRNALRYAASL